MLSFVAPSGRTLASSTKGPAAALDIGAEIGKKI
jgi:hypothetical protein